MTPGRLQYGFKPLASPQQHVQPQFTQPQLQQQQDVQLQYVYPQYSSLQLPTVQIQPQYQYQQFDNVPYVVDNRLVQSSKSDQQNYYGQQLVYFQPFTSSTANIQTVVDPKGNLKYYMYVPTQHFSEVKTTEEPTKGIQVQTQLPSYVNVGPQIFTREPDYRQLPQSESQYITQPQLPPQPVTQTVQYVPSTQATPQLPQVQYVQATQESLVQTPLPTTEPHPKSQYIAKGHPQSLLDSYVPSVLQLQYYKQQQDSRGNAVQNAKSVGSRTTLSRQTVTVPNAQIETNYNFQLPSTYKTQPTSQN